MNYAIWDTEKDVVDVQDYFSADQLINKNEDKTIQVFLQNIYNQKEIVK